MMLWIWFAFTALLFIKPVTKLVRLSLSSDEASYLLVIPFLAAWLVYLERRKILRVTERDFQLASLFLLFSLPFLLAGFFLSLDYRLSAFIASLVFLWLAGFAFCFGRESMRSGTFACGLLFLTVPIPSPLLNRAIHALQAGSAEVTEVLFDLAGIPTLREGFIFHLSRINIEVARECSGIRSSVALFIITLLISHFRLRSWWAKGVFLIVGLLMTILKNGIRIVTLTILALRVDPSFLYGRLHHEGGVVFFLIGLLLLVPCLWILEKTESRISNSASFADGQQA